MENYSYEDIYELLRTEKYSTDLQPLGKEELSKIKEYLDSKKQLAAKQTEGAAFYDSSTKYKIDTELENAKRALKDLHEIRQKKIINRAIFTSRSDMKLKDSTNMLKSEQILYEELILDLKKGSESFLQEFSKANSEINSMVKEPTVAKPVITPEPTVAEPASAPVPKPINEPKALNPVVEPNSEIIENPKPLKAPEPEPTVLAKQKLVRFVEDVPQLKGMDLQTYGPYSKGDVSNLPEELAGALINQNKAIQIGNQNDRVEQMEFAEGIKK